MDQIEKILEVGAEGGSITLYGVRTAKGWLYSRHAIDQTPELLDEPWIERDSEVGKSWVAALKLLAKYPWHELYPLHVHPEFRALVFDALIERYSEEKDENPRQLPKWKVLCGVARSGT